MILADSEEERREALDRLLPLQQCDFEGIFEAMAGLPGHDPAPRPAAARVPAAARGGSRAAGDGAADPRRCARRTRCSGTRGCRLGLLYPEIYEMQVRAIVRAALAVDERTGEAPLVEIMHPARRLRRGAAAPARLTARHGRGGARAGRRRDSTYLVGTMIELPRACVRADEIADEADFFSFGTNDLTQTTLGFSRDDAEGKFLTRYLEDRILDDEPVRDARRDRRRRAHADRGRAGREASSPSSSSASAASTAAIRARSRSATSSGSTTSRARRSACRSRGSPRPRRRSPSAASPPCRSAASSAARSSR